MFGRMFLGLSFLFAFSLPSTGFAKTDAEIRHALEDYATQRVVLVKPGFWQSLGDATPQVIMTMYQETHNNFRRIRLIEGLAFYSDPAAANFLKVTASTTSNNVVRQVAVRSLGRNPLAKNEKPFFVGFLQHTDPQTRVEAALALQQMGDPDSIEQVKTFLANEKNPRVVDRVTDASTYETTPPNQANFVQRYVHKRD